jgi:O-antigen ligase
VRCGAVLAGLALALCVVGFVQYATGTLLLNERLMRSNAYTPYFRVNALFLDPNIFGRFLAVVAVGVAAVAAWSRDRRAILAAGAVLAVLLAGLLTTRSQSSLLALLVGLGVLAALRGRARTVLAVAGAGAVAGVLLVAASPGVLDLASDDAASVRKATSGRSSLLEGGAELFAQRPLAGWGSGSFVQVYRREILGGRYDVVSASHTIPMTVAVEQGLVGLAAYLALLAAAFRMLLRRARDSLPRAALAAAFAALVVHTLLYASFLEDPLAWALLGVGAVLGGRPAAPAEPAAGRGAAPVPARAG